jgi:hypothetical protein
MKKIQYMWVWLKKCFTLHAIAPVAMAGELRSSAV